MLIELLEAHERAMTAPDTPLRGDTHDVAAVCAEGAGGARQAGPACGAPMQQGSVMQVKREGVPRAAAAAPPPAAQARAGGLFAVDEHAEMSPARLAAHSTLGQEAVAGTPGSDRYVQVSAGLLLQTLVRPAHGALDIVSPLQPYVR